MAGRSTIAAFGATLCLALAAGCSTATSPAAGSGASPATTHPASSPASSPASDPDCPTAKATVQSLMKALNTDVNAMITDRNDNTLFSKDSDDFTNDLGNAQTGFSTLYIEATTNAVKTPLADLIAKQNQVSSDLSDNSPNLFTDFSTLARAANTDEAAIGRACGATAGTTAGATASS